MFKILVKSPVLFLMLVMSLLLVGCGDTSQSSAEQAAQETTEQAQEAVENATEQTEENTTQE